MGFRERKVLYNSSETDNNFVILGGAPMKLARPPIPPKKRAVRARAWRKRGAELIKHFLFKKGSSFVQQLRLH
ncbi:MAG: hypothetical protein UY29_C0025G0002 [Parcubacteria group bacterium GW2011_GWC2_48_17]|nr:MAG: hypothetical protein UY29_C0025G0002 [Parcubacteria group bacterium GW2011_GWC2_48_17]